MALRKDITVHETYISVSNDFAKKVTEYHSAYIKVTSISGDKNSLSITVTAYDEKDGEEIHTGSYKFTPILESKLNFIAQAYEYLKTWPEFADATDC